VKPNNLALPNLIPHNVFLPACPELEDNIEIVSKMGHHLITAALFMMQLITCFMGSGQGGEASLGL
jgi:hypothetical protein